MQLSIDLIVRSALPAMPRIGIYHSP